MLKVGDKVVCVKTNKIKDKFNELCVNYPKVNGRYTIRGFYHYSDSKYISVRLSLERQHNNGCEYTYKSTFFC